jgi:transcriptional antiterminator NusG
MTEEEKRQQWYAVHVLAGQENKVHDNLLKRIKTEEMGDYVYQVLVPTERVSEVKRGKKSETVRKLMPGYVIVNMWLIDENKQLVDKTWYFIRETTGVIGFAGTKDRPIAMQPKEVEAILAQVEGAEEKIKPKIEFGIGEIVKVSDGAFQNQSGTVTEIDPDRGKIRVSISIFGREAIAELEYWQIERA